MIESPERVIETVQPATDNESMDTMLHYCTAFDNNSGICSVVRATTKRKAQRAASDVYYGVPRVVRPATDEDVRHLLAMGGQIIEAE